MVNKSMIAKMPSKTEKTIRIIYKQKYLCMRLEYFIKEAKKVLSEYVKNMYLQLLVFQAVFVIT